MAPLFTEVKVRLQGMVDNRNYFFKQTTRADAKRFLDRRRWIVGMVEEKVVDLERKLDTTFPADFRAYLLEFGENAGELFRMGQDVDPNQLQLYQELGRSLLGNNGITDFIGPRTLFFEFHEGYACSFFHPDENDRIVVYRYEEGKQKPEKAFVSFTAMLRAELKNLERIHAGLSKGDGYFVTVNGDTVQVHHPRQNSGLVPRKIGDQFLEA
ncbi:MAG: SMI1/KNR4 family protein [Bacteroidota bacterium]